MRTRLWIVLVGLSFSLGGCASDPSHAHPAPPAAPITHIVLIGLQSAEQRAELLHDASELAKIPGVLFYSAGPPLEGNRPNVDSSYEIGFSMGFATAAAYESYQEHPIHKRLLAAWGSRLKSIKIFDIASSSNRNSGL